MGGYEHSVQLVSDLINLYSNSRVSHEQIIKIHIYMHVTLESLNKFIGSLASCTQGLNKFVGLLASCMRAHDLMHS